MDQHPPSQNVVSQPDLFIEGKLYRSNTLPMATTGDGLPIIDENDETRLDELLRYHAVVGADNSKNPFWPFKLLCQILKRERILAELKAYKVENAQTCLDHIRPVDLQLQDSKAQSYLKAFAILVLVEKVGDIGEFIREEVSDQKLPVRRYSATRSGKVFLCHKDNPDQPLGCFQGWKDYQRDLFERMQWQFMVPYFELDTEDKAKHQNFDNGTILPWCKTDDRLHSSSQPSGQMGGFAFVSRIKIDPYSHGFRPILEKVS
jgi:hypothetical protein